MTFNVLLKLNKLIIPILLMAKLISCQNSTNYTGVWYSPNALIKIDLKENGKYFIKTPNTTESGNWISTEKTITLEDSTELVKDVKGLTLLGHLLQRNKPKTNIKNNIKLSDKKFYWTLKSENENINDTIIFSDSNYTSSYADKSYEYKILKYDSMFYFTDNRLSNIGDKYALIRYDLEGELILEYYDPHEKEIKKLDLIKIKSH